MRAPSPLVVLAFGLGSLVGPLFDLLGQRFLGRSFIDATQRIH